MPRRTAVTAVVVALAGWASILVPAHASGRTPTGARASAGQAAGCEQPVQRSRVFHASLRFDGARRRYRVFLPPGRERGKPTPLVINLHGATIEPDVHAGWSRLEGFAKNEGFIVLTPRGQGRVEPVWNSLRLPGMSDDVRFVSALIDRFARRHCIDLRRVYAAGFSNGGEMASRLACGLADRIAAIATVAGLEFRPGCDPVRPVSVVAFHGTADRVNPIDGRPGLQAEIEASARTLRNPLARRYLRTWRPQAVPTSLRRWARASDCARRPSERPVAEGVTLVRYRGCRGGADVRLYRHPAGHTWPGSPAFVELEPQLGPSTQAIDANELMWSFFRRHRLPA